MEQKQRAASYNRCITGSRLCPYAPGGNTIGINSPYARCARHLTKISGLDKLLAGI